MPYDSPIEKKTLEILGNEEIDKTLNAFGEAYAIPALLICYARTNSLSPAQMKILHLWKYVKEFYDQLNNQSEGKIHAPADGTYRARMIELKKRGLVHEVDTDHLITDYKPTEKGEEVCKKLIDFLYTLK